MFRPGRMGDSAGSKVTQQLMGVETSCMETAIFEYPCTCQCHVPSAYRVLHIQTWCFQRLIICVLHFIHSWWLSDVCGALWGRLSHRLASVIHWIKNNFRFVLWVMWSLYTHMVIEWCLKFMDMVWADSVWLLCTVWHIFDDMSFPWNSITKISQAKGHRQCKNQHQVHSIHRLGHEQEWVSQPFTAPLWWTDSIMQH